MHIRTTTTPTLKQSDIYSKLGLVQKPLKQIKIKYGVCTLLRFPLYLVVFSFAPSDMLDHLPVRDRFDLHRIFQEAHKQHAPVS